MSTDNGNHKYVKSKYNFKIKDDEGNYYIFNSLKKGLGKIGKKELSILEKFNEPVHVEDLEDELIGTFIEGGLIVQEDEDELLKIKYDIEKVRYRSERIELTIAPTLKCNLNCFYCFQKELPNKSTMTVETADAVVDFIERLLDRESSKILNVIWYGGEPLLAPKIIDRINHNLVKITSEREIIYKTGIITNGVLLSIENFKMLKEGNLNFIQVTLDGPKEVHNQSKMMLSGKGTFNIVLNNFRRLRNSGLLEGVKIGLRVNTWRGIGNAENLCNLERFLRSPEGFLFPEDLFDPEIVINYKVSKDFDSKYLEQEEFDEIKREYHLCKVTKTKEDELFPKGYLCSALTENSFCIGPEGELYKCWLSFGKSEDEVGSVFSDVMKPEWLKWMTYNPVDRSDCSACKKLPLCLGGCPYFSIKSIKSIYNCNPNDNQVELNLLDFLDFKRTGISGAVGENIECRNM